MFDTGTIAVLAPFLMVVGIVWVTTRAKLEEKRIAASAARINVETVVRNR